jgi:hypothetical protein
VFGNRNVEEFLGPKRDEVSGQCKRLHNEECHNSCRSQSKVRLFKLILHCTGHVA